MRYIGLVLTNFDHIESCLITEKDNRVSVHVPVLYMYGRKHACELPVPPVPAS